MRLFKLITTVLFLGIIGLFIYQNLPTFQGLVPFRLNLYVSQPVDWAHHLYTIMFLSAIVGFVIGVLVLLKPYLSLRKTISRDRHAAEKELQVVQENHTDKVA